MRDDPAGALDPISLDGEVGPVAKVEGLGPTDNRVVTDEGSAVCERLVADPHIPVTHAGREKQTVVGHAVVIGDRVTA